MPFFRSLAEVMRMPSTAEEVMTFMISEASYFFGSFKYGLVSFKDFFRMVLF